MSSPCHVEIILEVKAAPVAKEARAAPRRALRRLLYAAHVLRV